MSWGVGIAVSNSPVPQDSTSRALQIRLSPAAGWPAIEEQTGLDGLAPGSAVTYKVWAPSGARLTITPYATDQAGQEHFATPSSLQAGWNTITWTVPGQIGVQAIGLQFNNDAAWAGRLYLDEVGW